MRPLRIPSNRILTDSSASSTQAYLVLRFQILLQVSPRHFTGVLQGIAAGIGISNLLRAILMVCLKFFIIWFNEEDTTFCLALSSFGFSISHFCFAFRFYASDICFHISGHTLSGLEVVCFLVSLPPDRVHPSGGLSFKKNKSCEASPCI